MIEILNDALASGRHSTISRNARKVEQLRRDCGETQMARWPVIGHEWAIGLLEHAITSGHLHHAYLFSGPSQVGKQTLALAFAQALLCETGAGYPCGECRTCRRIAQGHHPDVQAITAGKSTIQIEQIRALQAIAALSPLEGRYRVFILPEIERASPPAANALLKTLEEPPPQVVMLLTSTRRDQVLPTVLSRCQIISLRPLPTEQIRATLESGGEADPERAALLARLSSGRLGWAVVAHNDPDLWRMRARSFDDLLSLTTAGYLDRLAYADALSRLPLGVDARPQRDAPRGNTVEATLGHWASWWRDVWLIQHGLPEAIMNLDRRLQLAQQADLFKAEQVESALIDILETLRRLRVNVNARLALDVLALRMPKPIVA
jgi:DNA polymerase-3 subunit delta'